MTEQDNKQDASIDGGNNNFNRHLLLSMQKEKSKALLLFLESRSKFRVDDIKRKNRKRELVFERQKFYYLCKMNDICSLHLSASYFGQDHATASHGHKTISNLMETDKAIFAQMKALDRLVKVFVLNIQLFTWIENEQSDFDEMYYKGKLVGYYHKKMNEYRIVCQPFSGIPSQITVKEVRAFVETEFLKFLDCII